MEIQAKLLAIVSFCVLMENNRGIMEKAPKYILEKHNFAISPFYIYGALDSFNQQKVIVWGKKWGIDFEAIITQMQKDYYEIPQKEFREKYFMQSGTE